MSVSVGERAIRECTDEGRAIADKCSGPERSAIMQLCDELDQLTNEIADMMKRGMVRDLGQKPNFECFESLYSVQCTLYQLS